MNLLAKRMVVLGISALWVAGCSAPGESATPAADFTPHGPWVVIDEDDWGSGGYSQSEDEQGNPTGEFTFTSENKAFGDLIEKVSSATGNSITCADPSLLARGVNIEFTGNGPEDIIRKMADALGLTVVVDGPHAFTLTNPNGV